MRTATKPQVDKDRDAADAITEFDNDHDGVARTIMAALA